MPDDTFEQSTRRARELGVSRSEFISVATRRYLDELDAKSITAEVNAALAAAGEDDSGAAAVASGRRVLDDGDDW